MNELTDFWRSLNPVVRDILGGVLLGFVMLIVLVLFIYLKLEGII